MKRITIFLLVLLFGSCMWAQQLTLQAPSQVSAGQAFYVQFSVNANPQGSIKTSSFGGLEVIQGPMMGRSSYSSNINGKVSHSYTVTAQYLLRAPKEGTYTIGSAAAQVNGQLVKSQPYTIKVVKGSNKLLPGAQHNGDEEEPSKPGIDDNKLYARVSVNNSNPYKGEEVILSYKIYTQVSLRQYLIDKLPGIKGFWSEDLTSGRQIKQSEEVIGGQRYAVAEIRRGAIYGQEVGQQTIDPLQLDVQAVVPVQRRRPSNFWEALFDDPFFNQAQAVEKHLTSNAVRINVKPLPELPADKEFHGGVGDFTVKSTVDHLRLKANEALTYKITIKGNGNLVLLEAPELTFPKAFEVYDPTVSDNINRGMSGLTGSRTFEWILIPQSEGCYVIPSVEYTFFNPKTKKYVTVQTESFDIQVDKGAAATNLVSRDRSSVNLINSDINPAFEESDHFYPVNRCINIFQWIFLFLPVILTIPIVILGRRRQAMRRDEEGMRERGALKKARKRLRAALKEMEKGNIDGFYEEIYKTLWGCLSDKYRIPISQLNHDTVVDKLKEVNIDEDHLELVQNTLKSVDEARFAPGDSSVIMQDIYQQTLNTIATL